MAEDTEVTDLFIAIATTVIEKQHAIIDMEANEEKKTIADSNLTEHKKLLDLLSLRSISPRLPIKRILAQLMSTDPADPLVVRFKDEWDKYTRQVRSLHSRVILSSSGIDPNASAFMQIFDAVRFDTCFESPTWDEARFPSFDFQLLCSWLAPVPPTTTRMVNRYHDVDRRHRNVVGIDDFQTAILIELKHRQCIRNYNKAGRISKDAFTTAVKLARAHLNNAMSTITPLPPESVVRDTIAKRQFLDLVQGSHTQVFKSLTATFQTRKTNSKFEKKDIATIIDEFLERAAERARKHEEAYKLVDVRTLIRDNDLKSRILHYNKSILANITECMEVLDSDELIQSEIIYSELCPWYHTRIKSGIVTPVSAVKRSLDTMVHTLSVTDAKETDEWKSKLAAASVNVAYMDWYTHIKDTMTRVRNLSMGTEKWTDDYETSVLRILSAPVTMENSSHPASDSFAVLELAQEHRSIEICNTNIVTSVRAKLENLLSVIDNYFSKQQHEYEAQMPMPITSTLVTNVWSRCGGYTVDRQNYEFESRCGRPRINTLNGYRSVWGSFVESGIDLSNQNKRHHHDILNDNDDDDDNNGIDRRVKRKINGDDAARSAYATKAPSASTGGL